jgi:hypothetical protein
VCYQLSNKAIIEQIAITIVVIAKAIFNQTWTTATIGTLYCQSRKNISKF